VTRLTYIPEPPVVTPGGFPVPERVAAAGPTGNNIIKYLTQYDMAIGTHTHLTIGI
jgi:hypothetical protein